MTYSLLSVLPGVTPGTKMLSLAGIDTYGTAAGVDFVTSAAGVAELIQRFDSQQRHNLPDFFQAVLRTEIVRGDPARTTLVLPGKSTGERWQTRDTRRRDDGRPRG